MRPEQVCTLFASSLVGQSICMTGDGNAVLSGGATKVTNGTPTTETTTVCPSGPSCKALQSQLINANSEGIGGSVSSPAGDFSVCGYYQITRIFNDPQQVLNIGTWGYLAHNAGNEVWFHMPPATVKAAAPQSSNVWKFTCGTYQRVGAGTSIGTLYVNGQQVAQLSTLPLPAVQTSLMQFLGTSSNHHRGALLFYTETVLSPATISAMYQTIVGQPATTRNGSAIAYEVTSETSCRTPDGYLNRIQNKMPCITQMIGTTDSALMVEPSSTNVLPYSDVLGAWAGWTHTNAGETNTDITAFPTPGGGTLMLGLIETATTGEHIISRPTTLTTGSAATISALFHPSARTFAGLRYGTLTATIDLTTGATSNFGNANVTAKSEAYANGWWRLSMTIASAATVANATYGVMVAQSLATINYAGTAGSGVYVAAMQAEQMAAATLPIFTQGTAGTRTIETHIASVPPFMNDSDGCASGRVRLLESMGSTQYHHISTANAVGLFWLSLKNFNQVQTDDSGAPFALNGADARTAPVIEKVTWTGGTKTLFSNAANLSQASTPPINGATWQIGFGGTPQNPSSPFWGYLSSVKLGNLSNACD